MPFSTLTDEQILALLAEHPRMLEVPGVVLVCVEFADIRSREVVLVATVFAGKHRNEISQLPVSVAGLPVIVKVEEPRTGQVLEIIDPRKKGGEWPSSCQLESGA